MARRPKNLRIEPFIKEHSGSMHVEDIAVELDCSVSFVRRKAAQLGVSIIHKRIIEQRELLDKIILNKGGMMTAREISAQTGINEMTVRSRAWKLKVKLKSMVRTVSNNGPVSAEPVTDEVVSDEVVMFSDRFFSFMTPI